MPLQRRVPKRGFKNPFRTVYEVVNVGDLGRLETAEVTKAALHEAGLIRSTDLDVKVLGKGKLDKAVNVTVEAFSAGARNAIETAGGTCTVLRKERRDFRMKQASEDQPL
jgi:large subunit ribosomal protein L15